MRETDEAIAKRVIDGDREAFRVLVERHARRLYRIAWRFTRSDSDAEDIVQDTFIRAWDKLDSFDLTTSFSSWISQIAANRSRDVLRQRNNPDRGGTDVEGLPAGMMAVSADQERHLESLRARADLEAAMQSLSDSERLAFEMRHFEGLSIDEIGQVLGTRTNATKSAIFRAVRKMRDALSSGGERRHAFE